MFSFCPALNKVFYGSLGESSSPVVQSSCPVQWLYPPSKNQLRDPVQDFTAWLHYLLVITISHLIR